MSIPDDGIPGWERAELGRAIHACESGALIAFYGHFRPLLLDRAVSFGVPDNERSDAVETFLGDMLLSLAGREQLPNHLHGYVLISFRRFAARRGKAHEIEERALGEYKTILDESSIKSVAEVQAAYHARSAPLSRENSDPRPALLTFCEMLLAQLDAEDRFLLAAKAEEMPLREIASLLGVNYNAANTRLCRLRAKLRATASDVVMRMDGAERLVVEKFLRRARHSDVAGNTDAGNTLGASDSRRFGNE